MTNGNDRLDRIEASLQELLRQQQQTNNRLLRTNDKLQDMGDNLQDVGQRLARIEGQLDTMQPAFAKIPDLAEKTGELKNWKAIAIIVIAAAVGLVVRYLDN